MSTADKKRLREELRIEAEGVERWKAAERATKRAEQRAKSRLHRECFWTWPWGHVYESTPAKSAKVCLSCGKVKDTSYSTGGGY